MACAPLIASSTAERVDGHTVAAAALVRGRRHLSVTGLVEAWIAARSRE